MSRPDEEFSLITFVQDEMVEDLSENLARLLDLLPSVTRLRLLAFMHLVEHPGTMRATLEVHSSGSLRLTLDTEVTACSSHQH